MERPDEERYLEIARALHGLRSDKCVALLMTMVGEVIEQSGYPEIWDGVLKGRARKANRGVRSIAC